MKKNQRGFRNCRIGVELHLTHGVRDRGENVWIRKRWLEEAQADASRYHCSRESGWGLERGKEGQDQYRKRFGIVMNWDCSNTGDTGAYHDPETRRNSIKTTKKSSCTTAGGAGKGSMVLQIP